MKKIFSVNGIDYSEYLNPSKYDISQNDVYGNTRWTDANYVKHRSVVRTEVSGSVALLFKTENEYNEFIETITASKVAGGYNPVTLYVNNTNETKTVNAYLTLKTTVAHKAKAFGGEWGVASVVVTVEER